MLLQLHVPRTFVAYMPGVRDRAMCRALLSLRGDNQTARGLVNNIRLTDRDVRMLVKCGICRWLTTDQLRRLYFPKATLNAVQKQHVIDNGTYNPDGTVNMRTALRLGWNKVWAPTDHPAKVAPADAEKK